MNNSVSESQVTPTDLPETVAAQSQNETAQSLLGDVESNDNAPAQPSLLAIRQAQQMSSEFVAASLRLSNAQILALESGRWHELPGPAYVKGFLRSYCKLLAIDPMPYIEQYAVAVGHNIDKAIAPVPQTVNAGPAQLTAPQTLGTFDHKTLLSSQSQIIGFLATMCITATLVFILVWEREAWVPMVKAQWSKLSGTQPNAQPTVPVNTHENGQTSQSGVNALTPDNVVIVTPGTTPAGTAASSLASTPAKSNESVNKAAATQQPPTVSTPSVVVKTSATDLRKLDTIMTPAPTQPSKVGAAPVNTSAPVNVVATANVAAAKPVDILPQTTLELQFTSTVWVEVKDKNGVVLLTGAHPANTKNQLKVSLPVFLVVGAAHALKVKVNGQPFDLAPYTIADVARVKI